MRYPATLNCIICGKTATGHAGHVIGKERMALGNYIDISIGAGWCDEHTRIIDNIFYSIGADGNILDSDEFGCYGQYDNKTMGIRELFS